MNWIIISADRPAQLQLLLESAAEYFPSVFPYVVFDASSTEMLSAYGLVHERFRAAWHRTSDVREVVGDIVCHTRPNGTLEPMTLITNDFTLFQERVYTNDAWAALLDNDTLGLSLFRSSKETGPGLLSEPSTRTQSERFSWRWREATTPWREPFSLGTIYRTSDLIGPLTRTVWGTPGTLCSAMETEVSFDRRPKLQCLGDPALALYPTREPTLGKYLNGQCIDRSRIDETLDNYRWKIWKD